MEKYIQDVIKLVDLGQNLPLYQIIYEGLRTAIISGVIPTGERINEKQYAECLNVSRTPVREALRRIQDEDIVEYVPNYGIVVRQFSMEDVHEIYQIRTSLDILAAENAMVMMTEEDFRIMEDLLDRTDEAQRENNVKQVINLSREFNSLIFQFARMPRLEAIQNRLHDYLARFRNISLSADARREHALHEHRLILRCLKNKDTEQLRMVIAEHLALSEDFILDEFTELIR
ncbi:GntR family transcriptional regulator [Erysipelothrix larvae]|uniref:GntR family transcriptional regulator n=1 Tax=Erysipelothrix larvae TaxID=1514105 RepID=A0A0X8H154_9FIRM|nr:GntR family transcriptional regulator [Erysipelothrix larvae]AMC94163.1 GntR family transcriptional regulator [Erysipelothrix larvae]